MADFRGDRRDALVALLDEAGLDGLIVSHMPNVRYLTGFSGSAAVVVVFPDELVFFSDFRYRVQAEHDIGDAARIEIVPNDIWSRVWRVVAERRRLGRLGFEGHVVSVKQAAEFTPPDFAALLEPARPLVEQLRARKDPSEVAAIREAARLACEALESALGQIRVGFSELEVAATLESELRLRGSEWHPFPTIAASGPRSALPHAGTTSRVIQPGELVLLDFGAQVDGYCADITRTVLMGRTADERQRVAYDLVREAHRRAVGGIHAGMSGREADGLARSVIEERGFGDAFGHSLGHGLGLEVHENPRVSKANEAALPEAAVVTVEPGLYFPGWGGVRIEDDVFLSAEGCELLSDGMTELRELT
ncbi:MAG: aminopeptidase P family protein [Gemmatimonadota bacterium]|nr:MAG: aminopeptidase P family protein [Gemmatimonadota bacterium]